MYAVDELRIKKINEMDIKERLKKEFSVPDNWDKYEYSTPRYDFYDLVHAAEVIANSSDDIQNVSNLVKPCTSCKYLRKIVADGVTVDMWGCDKSGMYLTNPDNFSCQSHTNDC